MPDSTPIQPPPPEATPISGIEALPHGELQHALIYVAANRIMRPSYVVSIVMGLVLLIILLFMVLVGVSWSPVGKFPYVVVGIIVLCLIGLIVITDVIQSLYCLLSPQKAAQVTARKLHMTEWAALLTVEPSSERQECARQLLGKLFNAPADSSSDIIEFHYMEHLSALSWRGLLLDDLVLLYHQDMNGGRTPRNLHFLFPVELEVQETGVQKGKKVKAVFTVGEKKYTGWISTVCLERYQKWKKTS